MSEFQLSYLIAGDPMKTLPKVLLISLLGLLYGCATGLTPALSKQEIVSLPEVDRIQTRELGDRLVGKLERITMDSVRLNSDWATKELCWRWTHYQGGNDEAVGTNGKIRKFSPNEVYINGGILNGTPLDRVATVAMAFISEDRLCWMTEAICAPIAIWERATYIDYSLPYFEQELIFNGRVDNNLKFIYREFSGQMARGAFTQEVQYDLNESNIIGFKGARLEVIEATNRNITYRLIENFPNRD